MLKPVIAATAVLAIAGSSVVYAQRFGHDGFGPDGSRAERHHRLSPEDFSAFADARIAALKAGLELTPDQQKNWPAFEAALRNMVQLRLQRIQARQAAAQQQDQTQTPANPFERMQRRADTMGKTSAALKQIADAGAPLYQSLTDAQKSRFTMLARILRPHAREHAAIGGPWREGRGFDRDNRGWERGPRFGQDGQGWWGYGRRFSENDQDRWGPRHFREGRPGPHHMNGGGIDQDSEL